MGRSVYFEQHLEEYLGKIYKSQEIQSGLIIGASTNDRDIAIHFAPTPKKDDEGTVNESTEDVLDESWICQHAKQVTRMLPGGVDILGIFIYGPPEILTKSSPNMRQVLFSIYKPVIKEGQLDGSLGFKDRVVLQICSLTKKVTCRTFDISDYKSAAKPGDWKALGPQGIRWSQIDTDYHLDHWIPVLKERCKHNLLKQIGGALAPIYSLISNSLVLIDGHMRPREEGLNPEEKKTKPVKGQKVQPPKKQLHQADLYLSMGSKTDEKNSALEPGLQSCGAAMAVKGTLHCRAYIPSKATVQEAHEALKQDIIRSIRARYEIHCEDMLLINEEQQDPSLVHELPRRVFTNLPGQDISVCDYVYHGDSPKDSLEAFKELLNLGELTEDTIDTTYEQSPGTQESLESDMEERLSEAGEQVMEALNSKRNIILPAVIAALIATATGLFYYLIQRN